MGFGGGTEGVPKGTKIVSRATWWFLVVLRDSWWVLGGSRLFLVVIGGY